MQAIAFMPDRPAALSGDAKPDLPRLLKKALRLLPKLSGAGNFGTVEHRECAPRA
jgi:hypothetical protein